MARPVNGSSPSWRISLADNNQLILRRGRILLGLVWGIPLVMAMHLLVWLLQRALPERNLPIDSGRPRKVAYLRVHYFPVIMGGTLAHTIGVIEGFRENGWEVLLLSSDRPLGLGTREKLVEIPPPPASRWPFGELREMAYNLRLFRQGLRILRREKPGLLYHRHTGFCIVPLVLARLLKIPLILEFNSSDHWRATVWKERRYYFPRLLRMTERLNLSKADLVVTISDVCRDQILSWTPSVKPRLIVSPNAVNPARFHPGLSGDGVKARFQVPSGRVVVGFSGTFMPYHGTETLAKAILRLKTRGQIEKFCFLLFGKGGCQAEIQKMLEDAGCAPHVQMPGAIPFDDMPVHLAACDILVSPTRSPTGTGDFLGSPTKLFEYMAAGKAIVASRIGQIAEILEDGVDALLIPPDDDPALAEALLRLAADAPLRARLGQEARRKVVAQYTWAHNVRRSLAALHG